MPFFKDPNQQKKTATPGRTLNTDIDSRTIEHYVSTPSVDESGEVLLPRGADLSRFKKSPTVFDVHSYGSKDVVGRNVSYKLSDEGHIAQTRFAERPPTHPAAVEWRPDTLLHLYKTGDISGWSIGFNPLEYRDPTTKDISTFGQCNLVHTRYRVLEYSVAPLPCNADALTRTLLQRGIISKRLAESLNKGHVPTVAELTPTRKVVFIMSSAVKPKASPPPAAAPEKVNHDRVVKNAVAIISGKLYDE